MKIDTNYWKTDKIAPTEITERFKEIVATTLSDLFYGYIGTRVKATDEGLNFKVPRDWLLAQNGEDMDDDLPERWTNLLECKDPTSIILDAMLSQQTITRKVEWEGTRMLEDFLDYMGLLSDAREITDNSTDSFPPFLSGRSRVYQNNIWEKLHDGKE